jgi:hypothetical protein
MSVTITGLEDVKQVLTVIAPREAGNLARSTTQAVASMIAKDARTMAPVGFRCISLGG